MSKNASGSGEGSATNQIGSAQASASGQKKGQNLAEDQLDGLAGGAQVLLNVDDTGTVIGVAKDDDGSVTGFATDGTNVLVNHNPGSAEKPA